MDDVSKISHGDIKIFNHRISTVLSTHMAYESLPELRKVQEERRERQGEKIGTREPREIEGKKKKKFENVF